MHISLILHKVGCYIRKRRLNFLLSIIILTVTVYLLTMVVQMFYNSNYYIYATKRALQNENIVNIQILYDLQGSLSDYCDLAREWDEELAQEYGDSYGKFMYMDLSYDVSDTVDGSGQVKALYMDASIMDLCELSLKNMSQETIEGSEDILKGYVGEALKEQYPIGTVLTDTHTGTQIKIVAEIDAGTVWLPSLILNTSDAVVSLDAYIVTEMDNSLFDEWSQNFTNVFNNLYIKCSSKDEAEQIKENVKVKAKELGIMAYCYTLDDCIQMEKEDNRIVLREIGLLLLFVAVISASAYLSAGLADIYSRHYELAVMYINHVSTTDMFLMLFVENLIKAVISVGISLFLFGRGVEDTELIVFRSLTLPTIIISVVIFMFLITIICYKTVNRKKLLSTIGGTRL